MYVYKYLLFNFSDIFLSILEIWFQILNFMFLLI